MGRKQVELSCQACGGNRLRFPSSDDDPVICEDCGVAVQSLRAAKALVAGVTGQTPAQRAVARRKRQVTEIEQSQKELRHSIAETDRLVLESDKMIRRHHKECDDDSD